MPLERFDGSPGSRTGELGMYQHEIKRRIPGRSRGQRQRPDQPFFQRFADEVLGQPGIRQARLDRRE